MRVGRRVAECSSAFDQYLKLIWDDLWTLWVQFLNAMNHVFYQSMAHQGSNAMIFACYDDVSRLQSNGNDGSTENHDDEDEAIRKIEIANLTKYTMLDSGMSLIPHRRTDNKL